MAKILIENKNKISKIFKVTNQKTENFFYFKKNL